MKKPPLSDISSPEISSEIKNPVRINRSVNTERLLDPPKPKRRLLKGMIIGIALVILLLGGFLVARAANLTGKIFVGKNSSFISQVGDLISSQTGGSKLQGEDSGQINILLLGIGGQGHDGPYLSDTLIVAQIRPGEKEVSMISIPRDYYVNLGSNLGYRKINAAFAEGYSKNQSYDEAGALARQTVEKVSGLTIPYFVVVDFSGFEKAVDEVGGLDITIDRTFTDYTYPDSGTGYLPAVTFKVGTEHMSGKRALIFARSRHAAGIEGSDFARSQRQQKIISEFKSKLISLNLITDSGKINSLINVLGDHVHTNLNLGEMFHLYSLGKDFPKENLVSLSLDPSTGLVCDGKDEATGAYILSICSGKDATDVQAYFKDSFTSGKLAGERSVIWMADSSKNGTLYAKAAKTLTDAGLTVQKVTYSGTALTQNVVYQVNNKPETLDFIKENLSASEVTLPPTGIKTGTSNADVIVILGSSSASSSTPSNTNTSSTKKTTPSNSNTNK